MNNNTEYIYLILNNNFILTDFWHTFYLKSVSKRFEVTNADFGLHYSSFLNQIPSRCIVITNYHFLLQYLEILKALALTHLVDITFQKNFSK